MAARICPCLVGAPHSPRKYMLGDLVAALRRTGRWVASRAGVKSSALLVPHRILSMRPATIRIARSAVVWRVLEHCTGAVFPSSRPSLGGVLYASHIPQLAACDRFLKPLF